MVETCAEAIKTMDLDFTVYQNKLSRIITDNYTIIVVFLIITIFLAMIIWYFARNLQTTLRNYRKFGKKFDISPAPTDNQYDKAADDENYDNNKKDVDMDVGLMQVASREDPNDFMPKGKKDFIENVTNKYTDYNKEKTSYIRSTRKSTNDDIINDKMLYRKHDDYEYSKKEDSGFGYDD